MQNIDQSGKATEIMVVDDALANLRLLVELLEKQGFLVRPVLSGRAAITAAVRRPPDLILLDMRMPEMNGLEVCASLKARESTCDIPILFISAHSATEEKLKAFQAGGVDYINKPFQPDEVLARIHTHLKIQLLQASLANQNERLESMVAKRTQQLEAANQKLALLDQTKSDFLNLISHELRTPLHGLFGATDLAFEKFKKDPGLAELSEIYETSRQRMIGLLDNSLLLTTLQAKGGTFVNNVSQLDEILKTVRDEAADWLRTQNIRIAPAPMGMGKVLGDWFYLKKALLSLVETVAKFSKPQSQIEIRADNFEDRVCLIIEGRGHNIPDNQINRFFDVLSGSSFPAGDLGLSPAVAHRIIILLGGMVRVVNILPKGIQVQAWLPRVPVLKEHSQNRTARWLEANPQELSFVCDQD